MERWHALTAMVVTQMTPIGRQPTKVLLKILPILMPPRPAGIATMRLMRITQRVFMQALNHLH